MNLEKWPELFKALNGLPVREHSQPKETKEAESTLVNAVGQVVKYSITELNLDQNGQPEGVRTIEGEATLLGVNRLS
jgi:hypothetical protein